MGFVVRFGCVVFGADECGGVGFTVVLVFVVWWCLGALIGVFSAFLAVVLVERGWALCVLRRFVGF